MNKIHQHGLKCDNPKCKYVDVSIDSKDYKKYINKGCPKCGTNLLTRKEYYLCKLIFGLVWILDKVFKPKPYNDVVMEIKIIDKNRFKGD